MTIEKLIEILGLGKPADVVKELQVTSFPDLPKWDDLNKEYDPMEHSIWDVIKYPAKLNENLLDDFKRTALPLQKLAVSRLAQSMFSTPVSRKYNYDRENESVQQAVDLFEEIYRTQNYIDSENIERCKKLNASCQICTVWKVIEKETRFQSLTSKFKLKHQTYSEMDGYKLYPVMDPDGELMVMSIGWKDVDKNEFMAVYIASYDGKVKPEYRLYQNLGKDWELNTMVSKVLEIFPVVYANISEPAWGGTSGTNLIEQLEEMETYQGMYIKRNALPTFTLDYGEVTSKPITTVSEADQDVRRIIFVGKGGSMQDVTWDGADNAVNSRYERIRNAFFESIQVPDTSFSNMIKSNTSAENKELIFADAKAKAKDLGGEWEKLFYDEVGIVIQFLKVMFSEVAGAFEMLSVRSVIQPYSIKTRKENAEYVSIGGTAMSKETQVRILGETDDVSQEVDQIQQEQSANVNQLM